MSDKKRSSALVPALVGAGLMVVLWAAGAFLLGPLFGGPAKVDLKYVGDAAGCVEADPTDITIFKEGVLKPKRVKWKQNTPGYHWEIAFKPYGGKVIDYLGAVPPIECGKKNTTSGRPAKFPGELHWYYSVTVFECDDGKQGDEVCKLDPMVRILR